MAVDVDVTSAQNVAADLSACVDRVCGQDQRFASVVALGHAVWAELLTEDPDDKEHLAASVERAGVLLDMLGRHVAASGVGEEGAQSIRAAIAAVCDPLGIVAESREASGCSGARSFAAMALSVFPQFLAVVREALQGDAQDLAVCDNMLTGVQDCLQRAQAATTPEECAAGLKAADVFLSHASDAWERSHSPQLWALFFGIGAAIRHGCEWAKEEALAQARAGG